MMQINREWQKNASKAIKAHDDQVRKNNRDQQDKAALRRSALATAANKLDSAILNAIDIAKKDGLDLSTIIDELRFRTDRLR